MKQTPHASIGMTPPLSERAATVLAAMTITAMLLAPASVFAQARRTDRVGDAAAAKQHISLVALPDVTMKAGTLVDSTGRVLWARNADRERPMASITKIMTAVVVLEAAKGNLNRAVVVPPIALSVGESAAELHAGEKVTIRRLLEDLMVKSGNDAATALAVTTAGSQAAFVKRMNAKAKELGLAHTRFANPHGLDQAGHYTSARDIEVLTRLAMRSPEFRRIVAIEYIRIGSGSSRHRVHNSNLLLGTYAGANGVKTGWTDGAGYSLVASAKRGGSQLYAVVLGTASDQARFAEARTLLDWGFAHYRRQQLATKGTVVATPRVKDYIDVAVPVAVSRDASASVIDVQGPIRRTVSVDTSLAAPVKTGEQVGKITYTQQGRVLAAVPLVATQSVRAPTLLERVGISISRAWLALFG